MILRAPFPSLSSPAPPAGHVSVLIIEARYYDDVADELLLGAVAEIETSGARYERVTVPGALEIPLALSQAVRAEVIPKGAANWRYCGVVALGCVIRGDTSHYDVVCREANHWLMELAVTNKIPLGNAVLTVETKAQALARARGGRNGKGGEAARACLKVLETSRIFQNSGS